MQTSGRATELALCTLRHYVRGDGLAVITSRRREYWELDMRAQQVVPLADLTVAHDREGFVFAPHEREPIGAEVTYGDTSMTVDRLAARFLQRQVAGIDRLLDDVFLRPAPIARVG